MTAICVRAWQAAAQAVVGIALACSSACNGAAYAGVVYNWQAVSDSPVTYGVIEISDSAWRAGSVTYFRKCELDETNNLLICADPASPILRFEFTALREIVPPEGTHMCVFWYPDPDACVFHASLFRLSGGLLGGGLSGDNQETTWNMGGSDVWTIDFLGTDLGGPCHVPAECEGATGRWLIDPLTIPATEPSTVALAILALAALGFSSRRVMR
jgi:hypothetical protein